MTCLAPLLLLLLHCFDGGGGKYGGRMRPAFCTWINISEKNEMNKKTYQEGLKMRKHLEPLRWWPATLRPPAAQARVVVLPVVTWQVDVDNWRGWMSTIMSSMVLVVVVVGGAVERYTVQVQL